MRLKGTLLLLLLASSGIVSAQFQNIMLDEHVDGDAFVRNPAIAINPRNPIHMVVGAMPGNLYLTGDGGATWRKQKVSSAFGAYGGATLIADRKGVFYCFHASDPTEGKGGYESEKLDRIVVQRSDDAGETWSEGESIGFNHPKDQYRAHATIDDKGSLYVTWTQFDHYGDTGEGCASNILFSMSKNGKKWSEPVVISGVAGNCDYNTATGAMPAVTPDGKVMIAWSNGSKIFLDRSFSGGDVWLRNDIEVAEQVGGAFAIPGHDQCHGMPVLVSDRSKSSFRGSLYIVWADQRNGSDDTDIWFTRSHNFGDNWSSPTRVNDDGIGKHQYLPSLTVDTETGYLYVVYYDRRDHDDLNTDVYLAYSTNGGASFTNVKISEKPFVPEAGKPFSEYNSISAHKGMIAPVWTRMDDGKTSLWTAIIRQEDLPKAVKK